MGDVIIVNPSANMKILGRGIEARGHKVLFVETADMLPVNPEKVFYFFEGYNVSFSCVAQGEPEKDDGMFLFKDSFISKFRLGNVEKKLKLIAPELTGGVFTDVVAFRSSQLQYNENLLSEQNKSYPDISAVCSAYPDSLVVTASAMANSPIKMIRWETDYDLEETFGKYYFVFFTDGVRVEAFADNGKLVTIAKGKNHMDYLNRLNKSFSKFSFKKIDEKSLLVNRNPWITEMAGGKYLLVNDYSFGRASVSMPNAWYEKCAEFICFNKTFLKLMASIK